jgi:hypothetical protein
MEYKMGNSIRLHLFFGFRKGSYDRSCRPRPGEENSESQRAMEEIYKRRQIALFLLSPSLVVQLLLDCA